MSFVPDRLQGYLALQLAARAAGGEHALSESGTRLGFLPT